MPTILGSLVLHAERPVQALELPQLSGLSITDGHHVSGRYNGSWREHTDVQPSEILLPQRYKRMTVLPTDESVRQHLVDELSELDAAYATSRQLFKLNELLKTVKGEYAATVNISNTAADGELVSGSFYLLSSAAPIYVSMVFDTLSGTAQLVWATFDFQTQMQRLKQFRYAFYKMPVLMDRPLFVPSQSLCSKWWTFGRKFEASRYATLRAANALELLMYKDPELAQTE